MWIVIAMGSAASVYWCTTYTFSAALFLRSMTRLSYSWRMLDSSRPLVSVTLGSLVKVVLITSLLIPRRCISRVGDNHLPHRVHNNQHQQFGFLLHPSSSEGSPPRVSFWWFLDNELLRHSSPRWKIKMWNGVWCGTFSFGLIESLSQTDKHRKLQPPVDHKNKRKENELQLNASSHATEILETEINLLLCFTLNNYQRTGSRGTLITPIFSMYM